MQLFPAHYCRFATPSCSSQWAAGSSKCSYHTGSAALSGSFDAATSCPRAGFGEAVQTSYHWSPFVITHAGGAVRHPRHQSREWQGLFQECFTTLTSSNCPDALSWSACLDWRDDCCSILRNCWADSVWSLISKAASLSPIWIVPRCRRRKDSSCQSAVGSVSEFGRCCTNFTWLNGQSFRWLGYWRGSTTCCGHIPCTSPFWGPCRPSNLCRGAPGVCRIAAICFHFLETTCGTSIGSQQSRRTLECRDQRFPIVSHCLGSVIVSLQLLNQ